MISKRIKPLACKLALLAVIISLMLTVGGCIGLGGAQAGWSGVALDNGSLYFGSAGGELIKMNAESGARLWFIPFETPSSGNILGCGGGATAVAIYGMPAIDGELICVATSSGKIGAFNTDGASLWEYPGEGNLYSFIGGPVIYQGRVYAAAVNGAVYAIDAATGHLVWETEIKEDVWTTPFIYNDTLYIGTFDKKVYALDAATGTQKWQQPFETGGPIVSATLADNGTVYVTSFDRHIYALDAASGELIWQFPQTEGNGENTPRNWFWASPVLHNGTIYAANMDGNVYVLDAASGSLVTVIELVNAVSATPVVVGDRLYIATHEGKLFYIDTNDNRKLELPLLGGKVTAPLKASGGVVYIHTQEDEVIYAINAETGVTLWSASIINQ
jgi:outer membrane protein assembly factor BamB